MPGKKIIKVIKKEDRIRKDKPAPKVAGAREAAREMVQTVSNWVSEVQQRQRAETAEALKMLFSESPRPTEA
jgi:hypothetical protein